METWVWLAAYLVGFALLQVYLYQYFIRSDPASESGGPMTDLSAGSSAPVDREADPDRQAGGPVRHTDVDHTADLGPPGHLAVEEAVRCDGCGAYNESDQMFSYCRNCGEQL